jgi:hypothetical protein
VTLFSELNIKYNTVKAKLPQNKSCRFKKGGLNENFASLLTSTLGPMRTAPFSVLRADRTSTPRKLLGLLFCYRLSGPRENWMQTVGMGPDRESNLETPVLWRSVSISCAATQLLEGPLKIAWNKMKKLITYEYTLSVRDLYSHKGKQKYRPAICV